MSTTFYPKIPFDALIAVELTCMHPAVNRLGDFLAGKSKNRRDIWVSHEDAYQSLKERKECKMWDDRVLRIYAVRAFFFLSLDGVQKLICYPSVTD